MTYERFVKYLLELHDSETPYAAYCFNKTMPQINFCVIKLGKAKVKRGRYPNGDRYYTQDPQAETVTVWYKPPTIKKLFESLLKGHACLEFYLDYKSLPKEEHEKWEKMLSEMTEKGVCINDIPEMA